MDLGHYLAAHYSAIMIGAEYPMGLRRRADRSDRTHVASTAFCTTCESRLGHVARVIVLSAAQSGWRERKRCGRVAMYWRTELSSGSPAAMASPAKLFDG